MSKRKPPQSYDEPEDYADDRYAADDDAYDANGVAGEYNQYGQSDDYGDDIYDDEYVEGDPYGERYEVAPDDVDPEFEVYDEVYQRVSKRAEKTLERPRRTRRRPPEPLPPGRVRGFLERRKKTLLSAALAVFILTLFVTLWQSSSPRNEFSALAPNVAPPVVQCGGAWPQDVALTGHTVPALIKNNLSWAGERHGYQFHGAAGQTWRLTAEARGGSMLDPLIRLYDPSGREVGSADDRSAQDYTAELTFVLPVDGAYCVLVESAQGGMTTGAYWLSAWAVE